MNLGLKLLEVRVLNLNAISAASIEAPLTEAHNSSPGCFKALDLKP